MNGLALGWLKILKRQQNIESLFEIEYLVSGPGGAYKTVYFKRLVEPNILVAANLLDNYLQLMHLKYKLTICLI